VAQSELKSRYAGSIFGLAWAVLNPILFLAVYAIVYLIIFRVRVPGLSSFQYVLYVFSGMVPFLMTNEAIMAGLGSVIANKSVLSNTVFPVELAPVKALLLSQVPMVVGMSAIVMGLLFSGSMTWTMLLLPVVWGFHLLGLIGLTWFLSLINLVWRDLQNIVGLILLVLMIVSPIAYTPDMVPAQIKILVILNPFAYLVVTYQKILVLGQLPSMSEIVVIVVMTVVLFVCGGYFFSRAKGELIDYV